MFLFKWLIIGKHEYHADRQKQVYSEESGVLDCGVLCVLCFEVGKVQRRNSNDQFITYS